MELWEIADLATPWSIHVVATLRVAHHLRDGLNDIGKLAAATQTDAQSLERVMRHLARKGIFEEPSTGRFELNDLSRQLLDDVVLSGFDLDSFGGRMARPWSTLLTAVRTGKPAYHEIFGRPYWDDLDAHPDIASRFDDLMGPGHGTPDPEVLIDPADWANVRFVVDVGGGTGTLLAAVLRAQPHVHGVLIDLPRTVGRSADVFEKAGVADRSSAIGQSFFDPFHAGADVYLLKSVLCDWPDAEAKRILARCAEAARPSGRVMILNGVTPEDRADPNLLMLVLVGGRDRTLAEFRELAREAGLDVTRSARQPSGRFLVECRPASDS